MWVGKWLVLGIFVFVISLLALQHGTDQLRIHSESSYQSIDIGKVAWMTPPNMPVDYTTDPQKSHAFDPWVQAFPPPQCRMFHDQIDQDFVNTATSFNEQSIVDAMEVLRPNKLALLHINTSGVFFVLPPITDMHSFHCLTGSLKTFRPIWDSELLTSSLKRNESISVLLNFDATVRPASLGKAWPIFSYAKPRQSLDILVPRFYFHESLAPISLTKNWVSKKPAAVFRGSYTNRLRARIAEYALQNNSDILDVAITNVIADSPLFELPPALKVMEQMTLVEQSLLYKFVLNIDGWGCADRLPTLLKTSMTVLYHGASKSSPDECVEWYHAGLRENVTFVPFEPDLSDLRAKIEWLKTHNTAAFNIMKRANRFAGTQLTRECVNAYFWDVLQRYRRLYHPIEGRTDAEFWTRRSNLLRVHALNDIPAAASNAGYWG
jgi:hypothetical protein